MKTIFFIIISLLLLSGCEFSYKEHLIGQYYVIVTDSKEDASIIYKFDEEYPNFTSIIYHRIHSVGCDENFIIVKQWPSYEFNSTDKIELNYYIIPLKEKVSKFVGLNLLGPMTKDEFVQKRIDLGIDKNLEFKIEI